MKPLIGITTHVEKLPEYGWDHDISYARNARSVARAGGLPVLIPSGLDQATLRGIYERLDGILVPGGGDVAPSHYAEDPHATIRGVNADRDGTEIQIARWAVEDDLPILGICRGHQVMNVALGGSLIQDIPSYIQTELTHSMPYTRPRELTAHQVQIERGTMLGDILGEQTVAVNSLHHQSVNSLAADMVINAYAPDGVIEGLEIPGKRFAMGVQWHPEDMISDQYALRIFQAFVSSANGLA